MTVADLFIRAEKLHKPVATLFIRVAKLHKPTERILIDSTKPERHTLFLFRQTANYYMTRVKYILTTTDTYKPTTIFETKTTKHKQRTAGNT